MEFNKVKKYQSGGYLQYQPLPYVPEEQPQPSAGAAPPTDNKKAEDGLDPEVLKKMIGEGVTSDTMLYAQQVNQAYQRYSMMDDGMKNSYMGKQLRQIMRGDLGQLNALARSKQWMDKSLENAKTNNSLNEGAVSADGQVVVKDQSTGKISTMSMPQLVKERQKGDSNFSILTNEELANEREYNPQLTNNSAVFGIIGHTLGMDKVKDEIYKVITSIGSSSSSKSNGAYGSLDNDEGLASLEAAAASGAFKIKDGETHTSNVPQIRRAQQLLWQGLSTNAKATLRLRAATMVNDPTKIEDAAQSLAADMLDPHATTIDRSVTDESYKRMGAGSNAANKPADVGLYESTFMGRFANVPTKFTTPNGTTIQGTGAMVPHNVGLDKEGAMTSLQNAVNLHKVADVSSAVTIHGDKVNPKNAAITGNTYLQWLPMTTDSSGKEMVDQEGAKKWATIQKQHPTTDANILASQYGAQLHLQKKVVTEVVSFSDSRVGWFDGRDNNYYEPVDSQTEKDVLAAVDPKGTRGLQHSVLFGGDNTAHKHLVIMQPLPQEAWREADNNHATLPAGAFSMNPYNADGSVNPNSFNTGVGGANMTQPIPYQPSAPTPQNLGSSFFKQ